MRFGSAERAFSAGIVPILSSGITCLADHAAARNSAKELVVPLDAGIQHSHSPAVAIVARSPDQRLPTPNAYLGIAGSAAGAEGVVEEWP